MSAADSELLCTKLFTVCIFFWPQVIC